MHLCCLSHPVLADRDKGAPSYLTVRDGSSGAHEVASSITLAERGSHALPLSMASTVIKGWGWLHYFWTVVKVLIPLGLS